MNTKISKPIQRITSNKSFRYPLPDSLRIKDEVKLLVDMLVTNLDRKDLAELIEEVETLESEKISEFLQETLLRRREGLEGRDYAEPIEKHKQRGRELTKSIVNLTAEIRAEMAEL
ncbi:hypothetical protein PSTT_06311 [Puccinia striiformis]|uniref:Uncharacterized protein n=1 Tax=Puccinia striiformis TaxID=27350 RepID=A0A2S4VKN3_9BASI|nr:hypothetical protein PSTT_06311 [Puccinia striiformis]